MSPTLRGMNTNIDAPEQSATFTRDDLARLLRISPRHVAALNSSGRLPRPIRLGRAVRWLADEFHEWLAAGAPARDKWDAMKAATQKGASHA